MIPRYLLAVSLVLGGAIPASAQSVNAGIEAWQRGNYAGAVSIWRPLAQQGDTDAQFNLGQAYRLGRGVPTNLALAKDWLERAASHNHVDAETTLGLLLFQNGDQATGLKWLKLAAEAGEPRAMLVYGTALFNGDSVTQDPVRGYAYVYRANASGLAAAKDIIAQIDQLMNDADKKKALAMVQAQEKAAAKALFSPGKPVQTATAKPKKAPPAKPAATPKPEPVQTAAAEPSRPVPKPAPAKPAPKPAVPSGPVSGEWRIQLGAFNGRAAAETAYRKLAGNEALAGRSPQYIPFQQFIRLRVGPFASRVAASAACSAVHVPCFPVAPGK